MRASLTAVLIPLALLMAAAKPVAPESQDPRAGYRSQGVETCTRELSPTPGMSDEAVRNFCGCTLDTYMAQVPTMALPAQDSAAFRSGLDPALNICILRLPVEQAAQMRLRIYSGPPSPTAEGPFSPTPNPAPAPVVPLTPIESADSVPSGPSGPGLPSRSKLADLARLGLGGDRHAGAFLPVPSPVPAGRSARHDRAAAVRAPGRTDPAAGDGPALALPSGHILQLYIAAAPGLYSRHGGRIGE